MPSTRNQQESAEASSAVADTSASSQASDPEGAIQQLTLGSRVKTPPLWKDCSDQDWVVFRDAYREYKMVGGKTSITNLLSPVVRTALRMMWKAVGNDQSIQDLCSLNEDDFIEKINGMLMPIDKSDALEELKKIATKEVSFAGYCRFNAVFTHAVENCNVEAKPAEELLVKAYINKLKPSTFHKKVRDQGFTVLEDCQTYSLKLAYEFNRLGVFVDSKKESDGQAAKSSKGAKSSNQSRRGEKEDQAQPKEGLSAIK